MPDKTGGTFRFIPKLVHQPENLDQGTRFFQTLIKQWHKTAAREKDSIDVDLRLCEQNLRLRFSSKHLKTPLTRAFLHCIIPASTLQKPDFTIYIIDGASCTSLPGTPWHKDDFQQRGEIHHNLGDNILVSYQGAADILSIYHSKTNQAIYWVMNGRQIPWYEQASPFRHLIHWWLRKSDWLLVHGAGIGDDRGRGLLIVGKSGSGKSTLAATTAFGDSFRFCGDDHCAVKTTPPFRLATIYPTAKLTEKTRSLLHLLPTGNALEDEDKQIFFLNETMADRIPESLSLTACILPSRNPEFECSTRQPLPPARMAMHLAVSSLYQMPHSGEAEFARLADLARAVPGWQVTIEEDNPGSAIPLLRDILN